MPTTPIRASCHTDLEAEADRQWAIALKDAVAFLGIERPDNPYDDPEPDMSLENIARLNANFHEQLRAMGQESCPTCGAWHDKAFLQSKTNK